MAQHFGNQSKYLIRQKGLEQKYQIFLLVYLGIGIGLIFERILHVTELNMLSVIVSLVIFGLIVILFVSITKWMYGESQNVEGKFSKGLRGEARTFYALRSLPDDYFSYQDIALEKNGNVDFVIVGNNGVFAIEVKNISGVVTATAEEDNLLWNGKELEHNPINQSYREAKLLEADLSIPVVPVLVLAGGVKLNFGMKSVKGVYVIGIAWLTKLITEYDGALEEGKRAQIHSALLKKVGR
jgi:hypothetical protein